MISKKFVDTLKLDNLRNYEIAHKAGIHPSTLSQILNGIIRVCPGDERVMRVGKVLGLEPDEIFSREEK